MGVRSCSAPTAASGSFRKSRAVAGFRFRLIDTAGSELAIVSYALPNVREGETVHLPSSNWEARWP